VCFVRSRPVKGGYFQWGGGGCAALFIVTVSARIQKKPISKKLLNSQHLTTLE
jgi:hypothetical protein